MTTSDAPKTELDQPDQPEVIFCNVCNQSIPEQAFQDGRALRGADGGCPRGSNTPVGARGHSGRLTALVSTSALVILASVVAGVFHLDGKIEGVRDSTSSSLGSLTNRTSDNATAQERLELAIAGLRSADRSPELLRRIDVVTSQLSGLLETLPPRLGSLTTAGEQRTQQIRRNEEFLVQLSASVALLRDDLRSVSAGISELRAAPLRAPAAGPISSGTEGVPDDPVAATGLPPALAHLASRLDDPDSATRYEAADQLLRSGDSRAFELVLPLAKDPDLFVRLVVLDGAAAVRSKASVDALLVALGDPESLVRDRAARGLQDLTGESFNFDPDAPSSQRAAMQRRWQDWWDKERESF